MTVVVPTPTDTIEHSREWLDENRHEGVSCPSCDQFVKVYRRKINASMAKAMIMFYRQHGTDWFHLPTLAAKLGGDSAKLRYWGLIEEADAVREDGGRAGYWHITESGEQWVLGHIKVAKYALIYNGKLLGFDDEENVVINDSLGDRFSYNELMSN
jgi:hypothetical protein